MTPPPLNNLAISPRQKKKLVLALLAAATGTHVAAVGSWGVGRLGWIRRPLIRERVVSTNQKDMDPWVSVGLAKQSAPQKRERGRGADETRGKGKNHQTNPPRPPLPHPKFPTHAIPPPPPPPPRSAAANHHIPGFHRSPSSPAVGQPPYPVSRILSIAAGGGCGSSSGAKSTIHGDGLPVLLAVRRCPRRAHFFPMVDGVPLNGCLLLTRRIRLLLHDGCLSFPPSRPLHMVSFSFPLSHSPTSKSGARTSCICTNRIHITSLPACLFGRSICMCVRPQNPIWLDVQSAPFFFALVSFHIFLTLPACLIYEMK